MKFSEEKREAARQASKLKRLATIEVSSFNAGRGFDMDFGRVLTRGFFVIVGLR